MQRSLRKRLSVVALGLLAVMLAAGPARLPVAEASSHREAPLISADPLADNTDVYAFVSPDRPNTVTLIANYIPLEEPAGGPNFFKFDDSVLYEIKIDNTGDGVEDLSLQFRFNSTAVNPNTFLYNTGQITSLTDPDWNIRQTMNVTAQIRQGGTFTTFNLGSNLPTPPVNIGPRSTPNYEAQLAQPSITPISTGAGNILVFAGQRDEGFYIDLGSIFDLLGLRPFNSQHLIHPPENAPGVDATAGFNVHSIAIQVPSSLLTRTGQLPTSSTDPNAVIGVWATASRQATRVIAAGAGASGVGGLTGGTGQITPSGNFVQVSRLGNPLVNELLIPLGTTQPGVVAGTKDKWNASSPRDDSQFASFFQDPEPARLIDTLYPAIAVPTPPRNDVVTIFGTGIPAAPPAPPNYSTFLSDGQPHEMMRLNVAIPATATPNRLGLLGNDPAGFPNGRRVGDDVVDIELRVLAGGTPFTPSFNVSPNNILGDGVNQNDRPFLSFFPYLATPVGGYENPLHGLTGSTDTTAPGTGSPSATPVPRP